ncbi:MAG: DUF4292 domain-containing protein [Muribaculaceae bacterium]|nr:DUF4292 domain-containing protein [Muribaculaceae bacterium]
MATDIIIGGDTVAVYNENLKVIVSVDSTESEQEKDSISLNEVEVEEAVNPEILPDSIVASPYNFPVYEPWRVASLKGKLKMQGLPISPSVKIFMKKDSLISLSLSAPFVGEAGRLELTPDSVTVVNKMKKTFVKEGYRQWMDKIGYGMLGISEVQNLLLARFFLPGINLDEVEIDDVVEVFNEGQQLNVVPKGIAELPGIKYGFVVDNLFNPVMLVVIPSDSPDTEVDAIYTPSLDGYNIDINYIDSVKNMGIRLDLKNPEWSGEAPKPIDLRKYRQLSFPDFMKKL